MKLTKKLEAEIKKVMDDYWASYLKGDLEHWGTYLVADYRNIGGTEEEIWNSKKEILDYTNRVIDQMQGTAELRNKQTQIIPYEPYIMVHELVDMFIKIEDNWSFYQKFRLSSLIQKTDEGWKVLHQHGSYPDSRTQEGEAFAFDTLKNENKKLQKAISERTIELRIKNRELEIEAAVERVRAQSMAMYKTSDLYKVNEEILAQLNKLKVDGLTGVSIYLVDENDIVKVWDLSSPGNISNPDSYSLEYDAKKYPIMGEWVEKWKTSNDDYFVLDFPKEVLILLVGELKEIHPEMAIHFNDAIESGKLQHQWDPVGRLSDGLLAIDLLTPPTEDTKSIVTKMAGAFNLAYQRFLDLQKAEDSAREAQIEAAVERVRGKALAMQKSEDLHSVVVTLKKALMGLNIRGVTAVSMYLEQDDGSIRGLDLSSTTADEEEGSAFKMDVVFRLEDTDPDLWIRRIWNGTEKYFVVEADEADFDRIVKWLYTIDKEQAAVAERIIKEEGIKKAWLPTVKLEKGKLNIDLLEPPGQEIDSILIKIGAAFDLAYRRFLDLQKAEAQAREAQIELALERVRSKAMAMHSSEDISQTVDTFFAELEALNVTPIRCGVGIVDPETRMVHIHATTATEESQIKRITGNLKLLGHPVLEQIFQTWLKQEEYHPVLQGKEIIDYYKVVNPQVTYPDFDVNEIQYGHYFHFKEGGVFAWTDKELPEMDLQIFRRYTSVLSLTYRRYMDLKEAEAQAREAQIELALERVRARTMAMQKSEELHETSQILFQQMKELGEPVEQLTIGIVKEAENVVEIFATIQGSQLQQTFRHSIDEPVVMNKIYKGWKAQQKSLLVEMNSDEIQVYNRYRNELVKSEMFSTTLSKDERRIIYAAYFSKGMLALGSNTPLSEESHQLLQRFAGVFDGTYTRFLDLQKAEAQAREAQIELGLERVRAKAMAMQSSSELAGLVDTLFKELTKLDILLDRCIIMLYDAETNDSMWWIAAPETDALPISVFVNYHEYAPYLAYIDAWHKRIVKWRYVLEGTSKKEWDNFIFSETEMALLPTSVKKGMKSFKKIFLNVSFNNFGSLTASSFEPLPEEQFEILLRFAKVFDSTYTRFNDLQKAEALAREANAHLIQIEEEKLRAETALQELKATQKQLIQSEKMASLGELTAGIAHEIQNPLNFVNNFSEVSMELVDELEAERLKAESEKNIALEGELLADIKQNLSKISHHGKRADFIVKGMLQHSRTSTGEKQPTDINLLADEFLKLSYHGLRAKDKSFNAELVTNFDPALPKTNVVQQDIGRVLLNLFNNAFYAVQERRKAEGEAFKPTVEVSTTNGSGFIEISVKDNGSGIPDAIKEKIMQPFFTTKPTGEGTGLGLSLSYDIVKAHGGELKVETSAVDARPPARTDRSGGGALVGSGTTFIIYLPINI